MPLLCVLQQVSESQSGTSLSRPDLRALSVAYMTVKTAKTTGEGLSTGAPLVDSSWLLQNRNLGSKFDFPSFTLVQAVEACSRDGEIIYLCRTDRATPDLS
ncbi:hypothetical protein WJX77_000832 [Trebouxia sp. C0004]